MTKLSKQFQIKLKKSGEAYRKLRELGGMTQQQLADKLGIRQATISDRENYFASREDTVSLHAIVMLGLYEARFGALDAIRKAGAK